MKPMYYTQETLYTLEESGHPAEVFKQISKILDAK